jgi:translation initiation factor 6
VLRASFQGSSYVGVFTRATDAYALVRPDLESDLVSDIEAELGVPVVETTVGGAGIVGTLAVGNEHGLVLSGRVTDRERDRLTDAVDGAIGTLSGQLNAAGNLVVATDSGAYAHPDLGEDAVATIEDTLDVTVTQGELGGTRTVGAAAVATEAGVLCHPDASESELTAIEDALDAPADVGTINYGNRMLGSGLVANDEGYIAGTETTGPELGRIESALGFVGE